MSVSFKTINIMKNNVTEEANSILGLLDMYVSTLAFNSFKVGHKDDKLIGAFFTDNIELAITVGLLMGKDHKNYKLAARKIQLIKFWRNKEYDGVCIYKGELDYNDKKTMFTFRKKEWEMAFLDSFIAIFPAGSCMSSFSIRYDDILDVKIKSGYINIKI